MTRSRGEQRGQEVYELPTPSPVGEAVVEGELVEDSPPTRERSVADRVVAVAMAVTVTGVAVVSLLNFLSSDPEPGDNRRKGRRR